MRLLPVALVLGVAGSAWAQYPHCPIKKTSCPGPLRDDQGCCPKPKVKPRPRPKVVAPVPTTATVSIDSTPQGARVYLNGTDVGSTPWQGVVSLGKGSVALVLAGHETAVFPVEIERDGQTFTQPLQALAPPPVATPSVGTLSIRSSVSGAEVAINSVLQSERTPARFALPPGEVKLLVFKPGYTNWTGTATVVADGLVEVTAELGAGSGMLEVRVAADGSPLEGAAVSVGGVARGSTDANGKLLVKLDEGAIRVDVAKAGHVSAGQAAVIEAGAVSQLTFVLEPEATIAAVESPLPRPEWEDNLAQPWPESWDTIPEFRRALDRFTRGMSTWGAQPLRKKAFAADASVGYPRWFELRTTIGRASPSGSGWDYAFLARSDGLFHELWGQTRVRLLSVGSASVGLFVAGGGGLGVRDGQNGFGGTGGLALSYRFRGGTVVSLRAYADLWSDRLCHAPASQLDGPPGCRITGDSDRTREILELDGTDNYVEALEARDSDADYFGSAALEVPLGRSLNFFVVVDGSPFEDERPRLTEEFNNALVSRDLRISVRMGLTARIRLFGRY